MAAYDLLHGVTVIEVAQLGPDALGGYLADMGARVIKIEQPPAGDPVRYVGAHAIGGPDGPGLLHLRWNRGKESLGLDLADSDGAAIFRALAAQADIVIDGLRGGTLDRLGLSHSDLRVANPALVFCSLSGFGLSGAYHALGSHAPSFDAFGALLPRIAGAPPKVVPVGMHAAGLYAAVGVLAALLRARVSGEGALIEVAAADAAANWQPDTVDATLNAENCTARAGFADEAGEMLDWPRLAQYACRDGRHLFFQAYKAKFWRKFCDAVERPDLAALTPGSDVRAYHQALSDALAALFTTRDRADWMELCLRAGVPAHPVNDPVDLADDPHFIDRACFYDTASVETGPVRLTGTPIRVHGQAFAPAIAPAMGQNSDVILGDLAAVPTDIIASLRARGVIA